MKRTAFAALVLAAVWSAPARADTLPIILAPPTYTPGEQFSFELRAPNLVDFSGYNIDLSITTQVQNPQLQVSFTQPGPTQYPFVTTANQNVFFVAVGDGFGGNVHL